MIAKEGLPFIAVGLVLTLVAMILANRWDSLALFVVGVFACVLTAFVTFFFRDPERRFPADPAAIVSPADGRVLAVETLNNHAVVGPGAIKVSIFLSVFDVHVNRTPASGVIDSVRYIPGKFLAAFKDKASDENEQTEITMTTAAGDKMIVKQIAGLIARRIVCRLSPSQKVTRGERFGLIRFGSRTELFLPARCEVTVKAGDRVEGGSSVIGFLYAR